MMREDWPIIIFFFFVAWAMAVLTYAVISDVEDSKQRRVMLERSLYRVE